MLYIACFLAITVGLIHSLLGEKFIVMPLLESDNLPALQGSVEYTKKVIRVAWHLTSIAWVGFGAIMYVLSAQNETLHRDILLIISAMFLVSGILSGYFSNGQHLSWVFFGAIAGLTSYVALYG